MCGQLKRGGNTRGPAVGCGEDDVERGGSRGPFAAAHTPFAPPSHEEANAPGFTHRFFTRSPATPRAVRPLPSNPTAPTPPVGKGRFGGKKCARGALLFRTLKKMEGEEVVVPLALDGALRRCGGSGAPERAAELRSEACAGRDGASIAVCRVRNGAGLSEVS